MKKQGHSPSPWPSQLPEGLPVSLPQVPVFSRLMSEMYDHSWYGRIRPEETAFFLGHVNGRKTLEIGSGTGRVSLPLLKSGCNLFGIEGSPPMLEVLKAKLDGSDRHRFILWNAMQTPFPAEDGAFEAVIVPFSTYGLLHHNVTERLGDNRLLHEIRRLLTPGGLLVINDYRTERFDRTQVDTSQPPWIHHHRHPRLGRIMEEQSNRFIVVPNRLFPEQVIRQRRTRLVLVETGAVLEEFTEAIPIWDTEDFPFLGEDAGLQYVAGEPCHFHEDPSIHHIFRKPLSS